MYAWEMLMFYPLTYSADIFARESPFYAELTRLMAADVEAGGPCWDLVEPYASEPPREVSALRAAPRPLVRLRPGRPAAVRRGGRGRRTSRLRPRPDRRDDRGRPTRPALVRDARRATPHRDDARGAGG